MIFSLNPDLVENTPAESHVAWMMGRIFPKITDAAKIALGVENLTLVRHAEQSGAVIAHDGLLGMISKAYSCHMKFALSPHDLWYVILTQIAAYTSKQKDRCRPLFTSDTTGEKISVIVETGEPSELPIAPVIAILRTMVPSDVDIFLPEFISAPDSAKIAMGAAFCDIVQHYYSFGTFCCGIPAIRIDGPAEDWELLNDCLGRMHDLFMNHGLNALRNYTANVSEWTNLIYGAAFKGEDSSFFEHIFTQRNVGSGGQLLISGWIRDFWLEYPKDDPKIENFRAPISFFPYVHLPTKKRYAAVYGAFTSVKDAEGFLVMTYDHYVYTERDETAAQ